jgi:hypothetical protein
MAKKFPSCREQAFRKSIHVQSIETLKRESRPPCTPESTVLKTDYIGFFFFSTTFNQLNVLYY